MKKTLASQRVTPTASQFHQKIWKQLHDLGPNLQVIRTRSKADLCYRQLQCNRRQKTRSKSNAKTKQGAETPLTFKISNMRWRDRRGCSFRSVKRPIRIRVLMGSRRRCTAHLMILYQIRFPETLYRNCFEMIQQKLKSERQVWGSLEF